MIAEPSTISNTEKTEKRILALDSQILDSIQKCPFYTYLNFIKNYRPNDIIAPLERGDLGHTLLEVYYKLIQKGYEWNDAVEHATIKGREHYQDLHLDLQTSEWVVKNFHEYTDYYHYDGIKILGVEESFSFVIYEDDELIVVYEGKIDLHAEFPVLGVSILDHKWRSVKGDYIALDNQLIGYSIAVNSNLVYINEVGLQKSYPPEKRFRRIPVPIGDGVKERWLKNTIFWAKILDYSIQTNVWPQSHLKTPPAGLSQCVKCQYNRICNSENEEEMLRKVQDHFHIGERWDVGKKELETNGE
jgi:PD-(D/E)XK nuclease superfamily